MQDLLLIAALALQSAAPPSAQEPAPRVAVLRVPDGGLQPQVACERDGAVHLVFFHGEPDAGDLFHARSKDGEHFAEPARVNACAKSAMAIGNVRGAHVALGRDGRVHVAWMGSAEAKPRGPGGAAPMMYTRSDEGGEHFERERNVLGTRAGLDGGGSIAADERGNVHVVWHAPGEGASDESGRTVWIATSGDDGKAFGAPRRAWERPTGACGCCGMRALCGGDALVVLYRAAERNSQRGMIALFRAADSATGFDLDPWPNERCVMSTVALAHSGERVLAAWETEGQVLWCALDPKSPSPPQKVSAPGVAKGRKHPAIAANARGEVLLAWIEGMTWAQGGRLEWQMFDPAGRPIEGASGRADGVPAWSLVAVWARDDGGFAVMY